MLRKLLVGAIVFAIAYTAGTVFGYRAAVVDYVENDAKTIESMADTMYSGSEEMPEGLKQAIEEEMDEAESDDRKQSAFQ